MVLVSCFSYVWYVSYGRINDANTYFMIVDSILFLTAARNYCLMKGVASIVGRPFCLDRVDLLLKSYRIDSPTATHLTESQRSILHQESPRSSCYEFLLIIL